MAKETAPQVDMEEHWKTYEGVLRGAVATILGTVITLIALALFAFGSGASSTVIGFLGLILGLIALVLDLRMGNKNWPLSIGFTVLFALVVLLKVA
jgi:hypothetical protein